LLSDSAPHANLDIREEMTLLVL